MTQEELLDSVQYGDFDRVKFGLSQGLNPNHGSEDGYSLVNWAAQEGYANIIKLLVEFGADVEGCDSEMPALYNAAGEGNLDVVAALIECGVDVNCGDKQYLGTALSNAATWGHVEIVQLLIANGAKVNSFDTEGTTPLLSASLNRHVAVVEILRQHGAQKRIIDKENLPEEINLASAVLNKYDELGYDCLNEQEKTIACITLFNLEVNVHGFEKARDVLPRTVTEKIVALLEHIGALHSAHITRHALALRNDAAIESKNLAKIRFKSGRSKWEKFGNLDAAFFDDCDNLQASLRDYMAKNRAHLPRL